MKSSLLLLCMLLILWPLQSTVFALAPKAKRVLVVATYTYGDNDRLANIQPIALQMAKALNATLRLKSYPSVGELVEAMRRGEADVAVMNTFGYLLLQTDSIPPVIPLAALEVPEEALNAYTSGLFASKKSGITSISQLKDNPQAYSLVFAGRHSTSGNLIPRLYLSSLGIHNPEEQFGQVDFLNSHANALQEVIGGSSDLAALGTGEYKKQLESGKLKENDVKLLWKSEGIPQGPIVCKATMPARQQKKLLKVLLLAHEKNPEAIVQLKRAWTEAWEADHFVPVSESYYKNIIELAGSRDNLRKVLQQHL
ncbi:phosphate/phosphite/phosphonate ABC transporter substrate-binding protein [Pontibacter cellulosilyticus]|uniref:PhnD/SsuA/transferrin family substrate-binding protein n=1 Tax=Pontibacter cellulosilyticus TaxID=1720253 RepID=A0A923SI90_9BACT|nr:PhnD/SsuA/transferrin family substrate-binding protein [Pontibacter cellulosilyticus]MBC5992362.1 PhnD/SsuA/transferrin family substrate-binding protein [Pontibacter cellulosilyticus]